MDLLNPAQDSDTHVHSVEFFCHSRARVWRARGIPNSAGGRGEGPGFFARQPRARMTEQEIEQDRNCHYDLQSAIVTLQINGHSQRPMTCHSMRVSRAESRDLQSAGILREARGESVNSLISISVSISDPSPCPGRGQARLARAGEGSSRK